MCIILKDTRSSWSQWSVSQLVYNAYNGPLLVMACAQKCVIIKEMKWGACIFFRYREQIRRRGPRKKVKWRVVTVVVTFMEWSKRWLLRSGGAWLCNVYKYRWTGTHLAKSHLTLGRSRPTRRRRLKKGVCVHFWWFIRNCPCFVNVLELNWFLDS